MRLISTALLLFFVLTGSAQAHQVDREDCEKQRCLQWRLRHHGMHYQHMPRPNQEQVRSILCYHWKTWEGCRQAIIVAWGESNLRWYETNGQYCSVMMMGSGERKRWRANPCRHAGRNIAGARDYYEGYRWGPWSCKPFMDGRNPCRKPPWRLLRP